LLTRVRSEEPEWVRVEIVCKGDPSDVCISRQGVICPLFFLLHAHAEGRKSSASGELEGSSEDHMTKNDLSLPKRSFPRRSAISPWSNWQLVRTWACSILLVVAHLQGFLPAILSCPSSRTKCFQRKRCSTWSGSTSSF
jgi:hypothetical protein